MKRTFETVEAILAVNKHFQADQNVAAADFVEQRSDLREKFFGPLEGIHHADFMKAFEASGLDVAWKFAPEGVETMEQLYQRCDGFFKVVT